MKIRLHISLVLLVTFLLVFIQSHSLQAKPKIAVFSGPTATAQNSPPLITSNQARAKHNLPLIANPDKSPVRFDHLVAQRLAAPVEVLIEQFSAHPLEKDAAELYGPPDGYVDRSGVFSKERKNLGDKPVFKAILRPEDGLYMLPYMALQAKGKAWDGSAPHPGAPGDQWRQTFYPDAHRIFEEIDRSIHGRSEAGHGNLLYGKADYDFYRAVASAGYTKGLPASERTDVGTGDIPPEVKGVDFFQYGPPQIKTSTRVADLAKATNVVQMALSAGAYSGAIWLEGSPNLEETMYWFNLVLDTGIPVVGVAAQRSSGVLSSDGAGNIVNAVDYINSKVWADQQGNNELGIVLIQDEQIFAARQAQKSDARPGGFRATGDHGGILGTIGEPGPITIWFKPTTLHTWKSDVRLSLLPSTVQGVRKENGKLTAVTVKVKDDKGLLMEDAIPKVAMVKKGRYQQDDSSEDPENEVEIMARIEKNLKDYLLAGFVCEGLSPYGVVTAAMEKALDIAALSGMPTVQVGRGDVGGMAMPNPFDLKIQGSNLTATKARFLLKAALLKFGALPVAKDPRNPTGDEVRAVQAKIAEYQKLFVTH